MPARDDAEDYWTERRRELRVWFERNARSLGELYEGSLKILFEPNFPGKTRFVAHAVREIRNRLPDVIAGKKGGSRVDYVSRCDLISKEWNKAGFSSDGKLPTAVLDGQSLQESDIPIPSPLFKIIAILIKDHVEAREKPSEAQLRLFEAIAPENQKLRDALRPVVDQWLKVTEWSVKKVHYSGTKDEGVDLEYIIRQFELFEASLSSIIQSFFKGIEELDEILEDANG
jgi:hypothetical protein